MILYVSVLVLTKNDDLDLPRYFKSVNWSDDLVVCDSFSTDQTRDLALSLGARIDERGFDNWASHQNWGLRNITWTRTNLAAGCEVLLSDGLAFFRSVTTAGCSHQAIVIGIQHPNNLPHIRWINTLLANLKTRFRGTFHGFNFDKYERRYRGGFCFRFNRCFLLAAITKRIANAVCLCMPCTERDPRVAEAYG